jgi:hypothetical protein
MFDAYATVGGGIANDAKGQYATIAGGANNTASDQYTTVGGGFTNSATGPYATVPGGDSNVASGDRATVGGGGDNTASGLLSMIGGGFNNTANGDRATVGGGDNNIATAFHATVAGGFNNTASGERATVGGGTVNSATNTYATVPGGRLNVAGGQYSLAAGRRAKAIHDGAFVWGDSTDADFTSTGNNQFLIRASGGVGIGTAPGFPLDVLAGQAVARFTTTNNSNGSVLVLQNNNPASAMSLGAINFNRGGGTDGQISFLTSSNMTFRVVGSERMRINASGHVGIGTTNITRELIVQNSGDVEIGVRSADTNGREWTIQSSAIDANPYAGSFQIVDRTAVASRFVILTNGNVGVGINNPVERLQVAGNIRASGSICASNGVVCVSDRAAKEHFAPVDSRKVLAKVAALPMQTWSYKSEDSNVRHIGPVAQDFHAAFGVGPDERHITTVDADGVALAAIQGLHQLVKEKDQQIAELRIRLEQVEATLRNVGKNKENEQ